MAIRPAAAPPTSPVARPGVLSLNIRERAALYAAYMPFLKGGGIFIPTSREYRLGDALDGLIGWTADLARVAAGGSPARNPDFAPALRRLGPRVARLSLLRYHRALLRQRALLQHPLQPRLVAETLLIDYRALFH